MIGTSVSKIGFLSIIAATGLCIASNGSAASEYTAKNSADPEAQARQTTADTTTASHDVMSHEAAASHWFEVSGKANYYPAPSKTEDGKPMGESLTPYF